MNRELYDSVILNNIVSFQNGKGHESLVDENGHYILINSKFISTDGEVKKCCEEHSKEYLEFLKETEGKTLDEVVEFDSSIYEIKVYASKSNIEKLKNNLKIKKEKEDEERELRNQHENTINEYESKLQKYEEKVSDLEYKICVSFSDDELCR